MIRDDLPDKDKVDAIHKLYDSLSDTGKAEFAATLIEDEELMARLLDLLLEKNTEAEASFESEPSFVDFLRKVRGE